MWKLKCLYIKYCCLLPLTGINLRGTLKMKQCYAAGYEAKAAQVNVFMTVNMALITNMRGFTED